MGIMSLVAGNRSSPEGASRTLKADIARGFGNARSTYESASRLQRFMGNTMLQTLYTRDLLQADSEVLDLGCGTGWFTRKFAAMGQVRAVAGVDLSQGMVQEARENSPQDIEWIVGDAEHLPLPDASCDLIFSNLMIQWCEDPRAVFRECRRILRPGGRLMVSSLLDGTLTELKNAWKAVDPDHEHVNHFETKAALHAKVHAELPRATVESRPIRLPYTSPMMLASELRHLGAGFRGAERRKAITSPGRMRGMCRHYAKEPDGTIMASYEAAWIYWQKH